jgi:hypothetical protein
MSAMVDTNYLTMVKEIYGRWKGRKLYEKLLINYEK